MNCSDRITSTTVSGSMFEIEAVQMLCNDSRQEITDLREVLFSVLHSYYEGAKSMTIHELGDLEVMVNRIRRRLEAEQLATKSSPHSVPSVPCGV